MSVLRLNLFSLSLASLLCASVCTQAEEWMRGAAVVTAITGDLTLEEVGEGAVPLNQETTLPHVVSGLLQVHSESKEALFFRTSNQVSIYNEGDGYFAIERFEQDVERSADQGKSRMILNFRQGLLVVDNRELSENSQMIVETPLGRISVKNGWWLMKIVYDERSRIYDFSIECADGVLRFNDLRGDTYTLRSGQRLSGAGVSSRPSIEVAEMSEDGGELFEDFSRMDVEAQAMELTADLFAPKMVVLNYTNQAESEQDDATSTGNMSKRPLLIEYAPRSEPVTPYRAVIRRPSAYEADMF